MLQEVQDAVGLVGGYLGLSPEWSQRLLYTVMVVVVIYTVIIIADKGTKSASDLGGRIKASFRFFFPKKPEQAPVEPGEKVWPTVTKFVSKRHLDRMIAAGDIHQSPEMSFAFKPKGQVPGLTELPGAEYRIVKYRDEKSETFCMLEDETGHILLERRVDRRPIAQG